MQLLRCVQCVMGYMDFVGLDARFAGCSSTVSKVSRGVSVSHHLGWVRMCANNTERLVCLGVQLELHWRSARQQVRLGDDDDDDRTVGDDVSNNKLWGEGGVVQGMEQPWRRELTSRFSITCWDVSLNVSPTVGNEKSSSSSSGGSAVRNASSAQRQWNADELKLSIYHHNNHHHHHHHHFYTTWTSSRSSSSSSNGSSNTYSQLAPKRQKCGHRRKLLRQLGSNLSHWYCLTNHLSMRFLPRRVSRSLTLGHVKHRRHMYFSLLCFIRPQLFGPSTNVSARSHYQQSWRLRGVAVSAGFCRRRPLSISFLSNLLIWRKKKKGGGDLIGWKLSNSYQSSFSPSDYRCLFGFNRLY